MSEAGWIELSVADCLANSFAGEWGTEPNPANALVLRATDIDNDGHVVGVGVGRFIPRAKLEAKQLQDGDILLEGSGGSPDKPVGRVALFEAEAHTGPAICSNFFKTLRPKRSVVYDRFLWRKLGWFYNQPALLALQQQTTGIINLKFAEYLQARIEVPALLPEQKKIAETLDTLDTCIRQTAAIIDKLKQVKRGLLHDLLTRGIDVNGELRPPQSQAPHLYKDSPLGWIPQAWDVCRLADYMACDITYGIVQAGPHVEGGVPYIRTGDMAGDRLDAASLLRTSRRIADSYRRSEVRAGEIVIAIRATVGKVLPVPSELDGANLTQGTARLAPNRHTNAQFLLWALRHQRAQNSISAEIKGTTFAEITLAALRGVPLAAPIDVLEQQHIGERLMACESRISAEVRQQQKLVKQKSGLVEDLLTGRVRVTPLLDASRA